MASKFVQKLLPNFEGVKNDNEEIFMDGQSKFIPFMITALGAGFGVIIFVSISFVMIKIAAGTKDSIGNSF